MNVKEKMSTSLFCFAAAPQESEHGPHGPVYHLPPHCLSLEHALLVSGLMFGSHSPVGHVTHRLCVPVPQPSEHCSDHSVVNHQLILVEDAGGVCART